MTAEEFLAKYPKTQHESEDSHLVDMACPCCGVRFCIRIIATSEFIISPDGAEQDGDVEWEDKSACLCRQCGHRATVKDFTIQGLDDLIAERTQPQTTTED